MLKNFPTPKQIWLCDLHSLSFIFFAYFFLKLFFIYLLLALLDLHCYAWLSLVVVDGGYSQVVVYRFLIAVVSLVVEHGL